MRLKLSDLRAVLTKQLVADRLRHCFSMRSPLQREHTDDQADLTAAQRSFDDMAFRNMSPSTQKGLARRGHAPFLQHVLPEGGWR